MTMLINEIIMNLVRAFIFILISIIGIKAGKKFRDYKDAQKK